ncbi:HD domain-containing protein [Xanthobacter sp. KR7-225]|uniref:HD domain-containing protein n=1 Tax=Xanthobacter sp. KR7-225 TaxID=3156613 RepID=UPI0032B53319
MAAVTDLTRALAFAAEAHANQRRKGAAQEPYVNHLIEVADLVARATDGADIELLIAALLHDVVEDTPRSAADVAQAFGARVARIVTENSDDMALPKDARRRHRIAAMAAKSQDGRIVKMADVISNLRAVVVSPPAGWSADRKLGYLEGCRQLIDAGRGASAMLEEVFDQTARDVERVIREAAAFEIEGHAVAVRHLENAVGQQVHLIYLPNTGCRPLAEADMDAFCLTLARTFPSATVQQAQAIYEGRRRPILLARIRTDSTDAIVATAQRLCIEFDQRFVGVEVDGRYVRIYADDTA